MEFKVTYKLFANICGKTYNGNYTYQLGDSGYLWGEGRKG